MSDNTKINHCVSIPYGVSKLGSSKGRDVRSVNNFDEKKPLEISSVKIVVQEY